MKPLTKILILAVVLCSIYLAISYGLSQSERQECITWRAQFHTLSFLAKVEMAREWQTWQAEQCKASGVEVF